MTVREMYQEAIIGKRQTLKLLIEYLVLERKVVEFEDDLDKLNYYLEPRFSKKMNDYLAEYNLMKNSVVIIDEVNVYQIKQGYTFYYVAALSFEDAEKKFKETYGDFDEIRIEIPELKVEWGNGFTTLQQIVKKTKNIPSILGSWSL